VPGDTLYFQFRYRTSSQALQPTNGNGRKQASFLGSFTCGDPEVTIQNTFWRGIPQGYTGCGAPVFERTIGGTLYVQQGELPEPTGDGYYCPYGSDYDNDPQCLAIPANTWMTFSGRIVIGNWGTSTTLIELWLSRFPGDPPNQFIRCPNWNIANEAPDPGFVLCQLSPYDTNSTQMPGGSVWYDEFIVSQQPIAMPTATPLGG
jgi:hypothetical protein